MDSGEMRKLRWVMDGGFWDLDLSTTSTIDGIARSVPGDPLPLGLSRGMKLSRPKQLDFMQRFMEIPFVPSYSSRDGFSLQRVITFPVGEDSFTSILGQFHLRKLLSSINESAPRLPTESSWIKKLGSHICDRSLYALGFCSEFLITPDCSVLFSTEKHCDKKGYRNKAIVHHKLPHHDVTVEAVWPGLFVDKVGTYWDVPSSMAIDLASVASDSSCSYHLCMHHNIGYPKQFGTDLSNETPPALLPGLGVKAAFSIKKNADIWRSKEGKLKMVQPYDVFLSDPHVSASGIIGAVVSTSFGDNSGRRELLDFGTYRNRSALSTDLFASVSCTAQQGNFQRLCFDLTRLNAHLDIPSGWAFLKGVACLMHDFYNSHRPNPEAVHAICPDVTLSLQQQIVGPVSFRVDSRVALRPMSGDPFARIDESIFAMEYALKVLGSAKAVAWYSTKHREAMIELRFFES